jgi:signal transduction histidine kinase
VKNRFHFSIKTVFIILILIAISATIVVTIVLSYNSKNELIFNESKKYFEQSKRVAQTIFDYEVEKISSVVNSITFSSTELEHIRNNRMDIIENRLNATMPKSLHFTAILPTADATRIATGGFFLYDIAPLIEQLKKIKVATLQKRLMHLKTHNGDLLFIIITKAIVDKVTGEVIALFAGGVELKNNTRLFYDIKQNSRLDKISILHGNIEVLSSADSVIDLQYLNEFNQLRYEKNGVISYRSPLLFNEMPSALNIKMAISNESFEVTRDWVYKDLSISAIVAVLILGVFTYFINRLFIKPIEQLKVYAKESLQNRSGQLNQLDLKIVEYQELANYLQTLFTQLLQNQNKLIDAKNKINEDIRIIKTLNDTLEVKVKEKTKALQLLNNNLQQKVEQEVENNRKKDQQLIQQSRYAALGEMIGNIAHQWRQPLSAISTTASASKLEVSVDIASKEDVLKSYDNILHYVHFLNQTIEDFRGFFRKDLVQEEFNIIDSINNTLKIVNASFKDNEIKIMTHFTHETLLAKGSSSELSQVFINILNNAKDIMVEKKIKDKKLSIFATLKNENSVVYILDNGGGIPSHLIEKVFDPYFTTKHKSQGTGIGLYMSKEIIEKKYNGFLSVFNETLLVQQEQLQGANFKIEIPRLA